MLRVGRSGVRMPVRNIDFSLLRNVQNGSGSHLASYSMGTAVLCGGQSGRGLKLTTHLHPLPRLRMNGVITSTPPICLHGVDREIFTFYGTDYRLWFFSVPPKKFRDTISNYTKTPNFHILYNSLLTNHPIVWYNINWTTDSIDK